MLPTQVGETVKKMLQKQNKTKHLRDYETRLTGPRLEQKGVFGVLV